MQAISEAFGALRQNNIIEEKFYGRKEQKDKSL